MKIYNALILLIFVLLNQVLCQEETAAIEVTSEENLTFTSEAEQISDKESNVEKEQIVTVSDVTKQSAEEVTDVIKENTESSVIDKDEDMVTSLEDKEKRENGNEKAIGEEDYSGEEIYGDDNDKGGGEGEGEEEEEEEEEEGEEEEDVDNIPETGYEITDEEIDLSKKNIEIKPDILPYIALIKTELGICSGALIKPEWIITAAHCISGLYEEDVDIIFGTTSLNDSKEKTVIIKPKQLVINPNYIEGKLYDDISLIRLNDPVKLNDNIKTIDLEKTTWQSKNSNNNCYSAGFGRNFWKTVTVLTMITVKQGEGPNGCLCLPIEKFLCSEQVATVNNKCVGDTGGPLVCNNKLVAIHNGAIDKSDCDEIRRKIHRIIHKKRHRKLFHEKHIIRKDDNNNKKKNKRSIKNYKNLKKKKLNKKSGNRGILNEEYEENYEELEETGEGNCEDIYSLTAYTNVNSYLGWIDEVMGTSFEETFPEEHGIIRKILDVLPKSNANSHFLTVPIFFLYTIFLVNIFFK